MLRSHQLDKKPIDLHAVINESLALVAHDMSARQIESSVNLSSSPCIISGDQVLLQQVLVNLVMNAMDAMAETPPDRRRITIRSEVRARRCRGLSARHWNGSAGGYHRDAVHTVRHDEIAWPRDRPDDRTDDRQTLMAAPSTPATIPNGGATFTVTLPRRDPPRDTVSAD